MVIPKFTIILAGAVAAALAALPRLAWAHHFMEGGLPATFVEGLLSGLGHPLIGLDHAAFIAGAGFLLALVAGGIWGIVALIAGTLGGAALHLAGIGLPGGEIGVALSVILIGALVIARRQIPLPWFACCLALAGVLHGHAYSETIFGAEPGPLAAYLIGFSLIQSCVAGAAFFAHRRLLADREAWAGRVSIALGALAGTIGFVFLAINVAS